MNCIWEIVLRAKKAGYELEDLRFINSKTPSPYMESSFDFINTNEVEDNIVEVNPLYRFATQLGEIFAEDIKGYETIREMFLDVMMHYVAVWDLRSGYDKKEYQALHILREIEKGSYYLPIRDTLLGCSEKEAKRIIFYLLDLYTCGDYITAFRRALRELYPKSNIYISNENNRKIIIFVGIDESIHDKKKVEMLCDIFLPLSYKVDVFWKYHFAVIGVDESMRIGSSAVY